jgi:hypothetical protein
MEEAGRTLLKTVPAKADVVVMGNCVEKRYPSLIL